MPQVRLVVFRASKRLGWAARDDIAERRIAKMVSVLFIK